MKKQDSDRLAEIDLKYKRLAEEYPGDVQANALAPFAPQDVIADFDFLFRLARESVRRLPPAEREEFANEEAVWLDYRRHAARDAADPVPRNYCLGGLTRRADFLIRLARGEQPADVQAS